MRWSVLFGFAVLTACGQSPDDEVVVFAAASLTEAFTEIGEAYADDAGREVTFSFAGSSDLAAQIAEGAPADVFASADRRNMDRVDVDGAAQIFATNRAAIVVEPGNPTGIATLGDLADPDRLVVVCAPEVPCGAYTNTILERAEVGLTPVSLEANVKAVVTKVALGEADAGVVYTTDIAAAGDTVDGVPIDESVNVTAEYPILALTGDPAVSDFVEFVTGSDGQAILREHGFGPP